MCITSDHIKVIVNQHHIPSKAPTAQTIQHLKWKQLATCGNRTLCLLFGPLFTPLVNNNKVYNLCLDKTYTFCKVFWSWQEGRQYQRFKIWGWRLSGEGVQLPTKTFPHMDLTPALEGFQVNHYHFPKSKMWLLLLPHRTPLTMGHLWQLPKELKSSSILSNFDPKWEKVKAEYNCRQVKKEEPGPGVSLLPALSRTFASQLLLVAALEVLTVFFWQVILVRHHH